MSKRLWWILSTAVTSLAVGGLVLVFSAAQRAPVAVDHSPADARIVVRAQEVTADASVAEQTYTGVVRARYENDLAFRVSAKIASRHVEVGERVAAGATLFRLDPTDYQLAVKGAEADLAAAEAEVLQSRAEDNRLTKLLHSGAVSVSDSDKARSARDMAVGRRDRAREALTLARNRLSYCELVADAEGVITALPAESGQVVAEGQVVARLARDGEKEAVVSLPENQVVAARAARAFVTLWSAPGESHLARLRELSPTADSVTRTYQARFTIEDPGANVVLGMTATVHLIPVDGTAGYVLPLSSLVGAGGGAAVWIIDRATGGLKLESVTVREYRHETVVLSAGVEPGQWVVTAGVQKLDEGIKVRLWEEN